MKKTTKKQLKKQIAELRRDLYECIGGLQDGPLKEALITKHPGWTFINDLQLLSKNWYPKFVEKYGNEESFTGMLEELGKSTPQCFHFYEARSGQVKKSEEPISATITL